jgi:acyl-coenzyme A synthetase/AMP-(fatty) acid ligase
LLQAAKSTDNKVIGFSELQELGRKNVAAPEPPKPSDLSTIMYTSGTTGALQAGSAVWHAQHVNSLQYGHRVMSVGSCCTVQSTTSSCSLTSAAAAAAAITQCVVASQAVA